MNVRSVCISASSVALLLTGCGGEWERVGGPLEDDASTGGEGGQAGSTGIVGFTPAPRGLHRVGNQIVDAEGNVVLLRGVNRSGSEYQCSKTGAGIFDGATNDASIRGLLAWNINVVRIPLNESCWLGIDPANQSSSGDAYQASIQWYAERLQAHGIVPILDLHWSRPGSSMAFELQPMPNADNSVRFWREVALRFVDNDGVIFEPFNEPYPDMNQDTSVAWDCWLNGCDAVQWGETASYPAVGMQALVDAIRDVGAPHFILLGGVEYSNGLSQWLAHEPVDPLGNLGAAWHAYDFNGCISRACWDAEPGTVAAAVPVVATEIGQADCAGSRFLKPLMTWLDENQLGYLAWSWNTSTTACTPRVRGSEGAPWALVTDYANPEPYSEYAATFRDHIAAPPP